MTNRLIATAALAAACVAMPSFADVNASGEVGYFASVPSGPSMFTRAEVHAELIKALTTTPEPAPASTLTRAAGHAELMAAVRAGQVPPSAEHADIGSIGSTSVAVAGAAPLPEPVQASATLAAR